MGYTIDEVSLISNYINPGMRVLDFGSQNLYVDGSENPPFVDVWYKQLGVTDYTCIDLAGDNNALKVNVAFPIKRFPDALDSEEIDLIMPFDITVDSGFKEHLAQAESYPITEFHGGYIKSVYPQGEMNIELGYYWGWKNQFDLTKEQGIIICVNPRSCNWPLHCYTYLTVAFYERLQEVADIRIVELYEHAACGNTTDGWNIVAVLRKIGTKFPTFEEFSLLPIYNA